MILDNLVKFAFGTTRVALNTTSVVMPVVTKGVKTVKDFAEAEVINAIDTYKDTSLEEEKNMVEQSKEICSIIYNSENNMIKKQPKLEE